MNFFQKFSKEPAQRFASLKAKAGAKVDKISLTPNYLKLFFEKFLRNIAAYSDYQ